METTSIQSSGRSRNHSLITHTGDDEEEQEPVSVQPIIVEEVEQPADDEMVKSPTVYSLMVVCPIHNSII